MKTKFSLALLGIFLVLLLPAIAIVSEFEPVITLSADGTADVSQTLNPRSTVSSIKIPIISDKISAILATDENGILLRTIPSGDSLQISTLGAREVNLTYEAEIVSQSSGIWRVSYSSDSKSSLILPDLSKIVSTNTIPIDIDDKVLTMPPGDISLSYTIRAVTSQNFNIIFEDEEYPIQIMTGSKVDDFTFFFDEMIFSVDDKAPILVFLPNNLFTEPINVFLDGNQINFQTYYQNGTHSWLRIDPQFGGILEVQGATKLTSLSNEGGGCLIATATFGSELSPQVQQLRELRDNIVLNTASGTTFMTGFNQFYYSFSPTIADWERENPVFKQLVKLVITPLLATLSILNHFDIDSDEEMLGFGIGIIILNIGIYFLIPIFTFVTFSYYKKKRSVRTMMFNKANRRLILFKYVKTVMNTRLFGTLVLGLVLLTGQTVFYGPAVFAEEHPLPEDSPIKIILDQSLGQVDAAGGGTGLDNSADRLYQLGLDEYR